MGTIDKTGKRAIELAREQTEELTRSLRGRWPEALSAVVPELRPAIDAGHRRHVPCPYHQAQGASKPDFRVRRNFSETGGCYCTCSDDLGNGFNVIMHFRGCTFAQAKQMLIDHLGGSTSASHIPVRYREEADPAVQEKKDADLRRKISRYWEEAYALDDPRAEPLRNWLATRHIPLNMPPRDLRLHPSLGYYEGGQRVGTFPTMLAMVRGVDGRTSTIHRTYLEPDGSSKARALIERELDARKLYPHPSTHPLTGAAIKFDHEPHPALNLAEGIESALAVRALAPLPTWSVISKDLLRLVTIPDYVRIVTVWADRDRSNAGQVAALELVDRLRACGVRAVAMLPPFQIGPDHKSMDWNDVLMQVGVEGARSSVYFQTWKSRLQRVLQEVESTSPARTAAA